MNEQLKPCPSCGGEASIKGLMDFWCEYYNWYFVGCFNDKCKEQPYEDGYTEQEAIEAWNRRVNDATN